MRASAAAGKDFTSNGCKNVKGGINASHKKVDNQCYLIEEWNYTNKNDLPQDVPISRRSGKYFPWRIEKEKITVPQQKNKYDCGLFVLYFMQRFIEAAPERLQKQDLFMFGKEWFQPDEASGLREKVREMLTNEFEINMLEWGIRESCASADEECSHRVFKESV